MQSEAKTQAYTHENWQIQFDYPSDWSIAPCFDTREDSFLVSSYKNENGCRPSVMFEISSYADTEAVLRQLVDDLQNTCAQFKLLKSYLEKKGRGRGAVVYRHNEDNRSLVSEKVIIPLPSNKILTLTATAAVAAWKEYAQVFKQMIGSVKPLQSKEANEVEIVFAPEQSVPQIAEAEPPPCAQFAEQEPPSRTFASYASQFNQQWKMCLINDDLLEMIGDIDLARVLWAALGSRIKSWVSDPIPALDGKTALQCFRSNHGKEELKALLLRMNDRADNLAQVIKNKKAIEVPKDHDPLKTVAELLRTPSERRDKIWYVDFRRAAAQARYYVPDRPLAASQAGFLFYWVYTARPSDSSTGRQVRIVEIIEEATDQGAGILFNAPNCEPHALSFGYACHIRVFGNFPDKDNISQRPTFGSKRTNYGSRLLGAPSEQTLPPYARRAMKNYMREQFKISTPSVFMEYDPDHDIPFTLVLNLRDGSLSTPEQFYAALEMIFWFVPPMLNITYASARDRELPFLEL
jgi:hypothetical protein